VLKKCASTAGQDLRLPTLGGTKFPTTDSTTPAKQKLDRSMAEVGPMSGASPAGAKLEDSLAVPKQKWASMGDVMDPMRDDPLVQYLKKTAEETSTPPLTGLVDEHGELKDNEENLPKGKEEQELTSECPKPTPRMDTEGRGQTHHALSSLFEGADKSRRKYTEKDHSFEGFDRGVVDRVLGL
jgi:hypothetical protein